MIVTISPTEEEIGSVLRFFLLTILPSGTEVIRGQVNRVAEPEGVNFVVYWPVLKPRLSTNVDTYIDCAFTGSIAGDILTVTAVDPTFPGKIGRNSPVFGVGVQPWTTVLSQLSGSPAGGVGTYRVSLGQNIAQETMAAGVEELSQATELVYQLDVHGPSSNDNAAVITTVFRDARGVELFASAGVSLTPPVREVISPLYCEDPRQLPFINDQNQYEDRFIVTAHMQVSQSLRLPQQFAASVSATLVDADLLPVS